MTARPPHPRIRPKTTKAAPIVAQPAGSFQPHRPRRGLRRAIRAGWAKASSSFDWTMVRLGERPTVNFPVDQRLLAGPPPHLGGRPCASGRDFVPMDVDGNGARGLWSYIDENAQYDGYEKLVDYHHTTEHLSKAAEAIFGKGSPKAQAWYDKYCSKLKGEDGGAERVLRSLDYYRSTTGLSTSRGAALDAERTFFARNAQRMDYARFRGHGWPIGSGPVEAACKSVVKTRLCRGGMRWSRSGGQHILSLRTYVKSDRWNALWNQYKRLQWPPSPSSDTT